MTCCRFSWRWAVLLWAVWCVCIWGGCKHQTKKHTLTEVTEVLPDSARMIVPEYAQGFSVKYVAGGCILTLRDPQRENDPDGFYQCALVQDSKLFDTNGLDASLPTIKVPVKRVVCMTTLHLSNFIKMDALNYVVGTSSGRTLHNQEVKRRIKEGSMARIGIEGNFDKEAVLSQDPDLIIVSPYKRGGYDDLKGMGIPLLPHMGNRENDPLGQAEWIKVIGLLIGQEEKANQLFAATNQEYNHYKALAAQVEKRPLVFNGELHGDNWYVLGGRNFMARLFYDSGAQYYLVDDTRTEPVQQDFETVYSQAAEVPYWRLLSSFSGEFSYDKLLKKDPRYGYFKAFKERGIIYCNPLEKPFYEFSPTHPEVVLKDFIKVFHPELLPDYEPVLYELLK